ncbi:uncharacterized protein LOC127858492 isoform X2 [Dreissena polymorpha]|uniref:Macro domain-containing protein n=1 Tax=Dreissena polymorpha TaxID=45954 RepID=A0A9D3YZT8_DREPO|nr:uncharacterized protein LOC127858492 isoform X2 [Dreissena polymorpha]KAH3707772.1 hypothetical protein DPMN_067187 [Dreissena polymorpha]
MSSIQVIYLPSSCSKKDLQVHFANPSNGGGPIKQIYYPLFDNDAVIIFEDQLTAEFVCRHTEHAIKGKGVSVKPYRYPPIYTKLHAELDPTAANIIQADQEIRDEIEHCEGLTLNVKDDVILGITGDWFQLEWVWAKIERFTKEQSHIQRRIQRKIDRTKSLDDSMKSEFHATTKSKHGDDGNRPDDDIDVKMSNPQMYKGIDNHSAAMTEQIRDDDARANANIAKTQTFEFDLQKEVPKKSQASVKAQTTHQKPATHTSQTTSEYNEPGGSAVSVCEIEILGKPGTLLSLDLKYGELKVSVYAGLITMEETDVIVNAAMGPLVNGGGVAWAIASNASPKLQEECDAYVKRHGNVPTSGVMHTVAGGKLSQNVKHVIHAVGPVWDVLNQDDKCMRKLTMTFLNSLKYGNEELRVSSISFPLISSGIFGCPVEVCTRSFLYAIILFGSLYPDAGLTEIHLVNNDENNTGLTVASLREMIQQGSVHLLDKARRIYREFDGIETVVRVAGQKLALDERTKRNDLPIMSDTAVKGHKSESTKLPTDGSKTVEPRPLPPTPNTMMPTKTDKKKK